MVVRSQPEFDFEYLSWSASTRLKTTCGMLPSVLHLWGKIINNSTLNTVNLVKT